MFSAESIISDPSSKFVKRIGYVLMRTWQKKKKKRTGWPESLSPPHNFLFQMAEKWNVTTISKRGKGMTKLSDHPVYG